jgi:hypothetical protein
MIYIANIILMFILTFKVKLYVKFSLSVCISLIFQASVAHKTYCFKSVITNRSHCVRSKTKLKYIKLPWKIQFCEKCTYITTHCELGYIHHLRLLLYVLVLFRKEHMNKGFRFLRNSWICSSKHISTLRERNIDIFKFTGNKGTYSRSQWPCGLTRGSSPVGCWDRGFESRSRHGCLSASFCAVLSCVGRGLATGWSLVQGVLPHV